MRTAAINEQTVPALLHCHLGVSLPQVGPPIHDFAEPCGSGGTSARLDNVINLRITLSARGWTTLVVDTCTLGASPGR